MKPTDRETAEKICNRHLAFPGWMQNLGENCMICGRPIEKNKYQESVKPLLNDVESALQKARADEREQCAKVFKESDCYPKPHYDGKYPKNHMCCVEGHLEAIRAKHSDHKTVEKEGE